MADIQLVETSLRDGNQSLWGATGIDTAMTLTIAPVMDRVGFKAIDFTTSTHMGVAVRFKREDPWERIRLMAEATPPAELQGVCIPSTWTPSDHRGTMTVSINRGNFQDGKVKIDKVADTVLKRDAMTHADCVDWFVELARQRAQRG